MRAHKTRAVTIVTLLLVVSAAAQDLSTSAQLISAMHDRYVNKWYRTLSFDQQSVTHKPDGTQTTELWHESLLLPGRLRINIGDPGEGNGMLFAGDHLYRFKGGKLEGDREYIHPLLVLGFDVYLQPADKTTQQLKDLHIDLSSIHNDSLDGRPMYVVGAKQGDLHTIQFWIDKERLYFVRLIEPDRSDANSTQDIRFEDYKQVEGGGWLSEHVVVMTNGKLVFEEKYSNVRIDPELSPGLFDPANFAPAQ